MTRQQSLQGWAQAILKVVLTLATILVVFTSCSMAVNSYLVFFDDEVTDVRFDGRPVALNRLDGFEFSRFALGTHRISFRDPRGRERTVEIHPHFDDDNSAVLKIGSWGVEGIPEARFVSTPLAGYTHPRPLSLPPAT